MEQDARFKRKATTMDKKGKRDGGFEDDPLAQWIRLCRHPEHNPPSHLVIPQGKIYRHVCPECGREVVLRPPQMFMKA